MRCELEDETSRWPAEAAVTEEMWSAAQTVGCVRKTKANKSTAGLCQGPEDLRQY